MCTHMALEVLSGSAVMHPGRTLSVSPSDKACRLNTDYAKVIHQKSALGQTALMGLLSASGTVSALSSSTPALLILASQRSFNRGVGTGVFLPSVG